MMPRTKNSLKFDGDDSSDEEDINNQIDSYNLKDSYNNYMADTNIPAYIRSEDPEGYSFLSYAIGVKQLYSDEVNDIYYDKKMTLGKCVIDNDDEGLKNWFQQAIKKSIYELFLISSQPGLSEQLANDFWQNHEEDINNNIDEWIHSNLRLFLKQCQEPDIAYPDTQNTLLPIIDFIRDYISDLEEHDHEFSKPPFLNPNHFNDEIIAHIQDFYENNGIMNGGKFLPQKDRKHIKAANFHDNIEKILVTKSKEFSGRETINSIKTEFKQQVFTELLKREVNKGNNSLIEKVGNNFRFKQWVTKNQIQGSDLSQFFVNNGRMNIYRPYNNARLKSNYTKKLNDEFIKVFIKHLIEKKKALKIKLQRAILPEQYTFTSENFTEFQANLRLVMRVQRRRIRQAREDEELEKIEGQKFQAAWKFHNHTSLALETQEITVNGARSDQVINLETYPNINIQLTNFKININKSFTEYKLDDSLICEWMREIVTEVEPSTYYYQEADPDNDEKYTSFGKIPSRYKNSFLKFLVNLTYLIFGCEIQRNPSGVIIHQMMLDSIIDKKDGKLTWTQAISNAANEKYCGGGAMPMSMGAYKKEGTNESKRAQPVACARTLQRYYGLFAVKPVYYDGDEISENQQDIYVKELVKRENKIVKDWLELQGMLPEDSIEDKIEAIENAVRTKWYKLG